MGWKAPFVFFQFFAFQIDGLTTGIGALAAGIATAYGIYLKSYEGSFKQQLDEANRRIAFNAERLTEISKENALLRQVNADLGAKLDERDKIIAERDRAIALRDEAIRLRDRSLDEQSRVFRRLSSDTADMAEAFLIRKGDMKPRANP